MADIYLYLQDENDSDCLLDCEKHWILVAHYKSETGGRIIMYDCDASGSCYALHRVREEIPPIVRDIRLMVCDFPVTPEEMENAARENQWNGRCDDDNENDTTPICTMWIKALCDSRGIPYSHMYKCEYTPGEAYAVDAEGNFVCGANELFHHYFFSEFDLS